MAKIKLLSPQLAAQIAAGEVIERPGSVVKELIENSLDAGANDISIHIESGCSINLIRIRDNGCGISKNELGLALTRHATSKINSINDLEKITSMGFRGEALASISSVSRIILTSRTIDQKVAWQAYTEGSNMIFYLKPAAHQVGTTVEVLDIFFNTPVRRKYISTIKSEFLYIDEIIRSIALSRFDVKFIFYNNGKIYRKYFAVNSNNKEQRMIRLSSLCNKSFVERSIEVYFKDKNFFIYGWLVNPVIEGSNLSYIQYIYVNNRLIIDNFIKNTIKKVYNELFKFKYKPAFVLFLNIDPYQVDINVHPKKNKIKFFQLIKVHSFIYNAIFNILNKNNISKIENINLKKEKYYNEKKQNLKNENLLINKIENKENLFVTKKNILTRFLSSSIIKDISKNEILIKENRSKLFDILVYPINNKTKIIRLLTIYKPHYALIEHLYSYNISLLSLRIADNYLKEQQLIPKNGKGLYAYPILIPPRITIDIKQSESLKNNKNLLYDMGIILKLYNNQVIIKAVPLVLRDQNFIKLIPELLLYMNNKCYLTYKHIALWFTKKINIKINKIWNYSKAEKLLLDIERFYPQWFTIQPKKFLVNFNLKDAINTINNE